MCVESASFMFARETAIEWKYGKQPPSRRLIDQWKHIISLFSFLANSFQYSKKSNIEDSIHSCWTKLNVFSFLSLLSQWQTKLSNYTWTWKLFGPYFGFVFSFFLIGGRLRSKKTKAAGQWKQIAAVLSASDLQSLNINFNVGASRKPLRCKSIKLQK